MVMGGLDCMGSECGAYYGWEEENGAVTGCLSGVISRFMLTIMESPNWSSGLRPANWF